MSYYQLIYASHSECQKLRNNWQELPEHVYSFGSTVHAILEGRRIQATAQEITAATAMDTAVQQYRSHPYKVEHEVYRFLRFTPWGLPVYQKAKLDRWYKGLMVLDFKTTTAKNDALFRKLITEHRYDLQACRYLMMTGETRFMWVAYNKVTGATFVVVMRWEQLKHLVPQVEADNQHWYDVNYGSAW